MFRLGFRLLPLQGSVPEPGSDITGAPWQQLMHPGEIALFCIDGTTGQPLKMNGEKPQIPMAEHCAAYRDRLQAKLVARRVLAHNLQMVCALYDRKGKWLETVSRQGVRKRNEGLSLALLLLQFPVLAALGTAAFVAASEVYALVSHTTAVRWDSMGPAEWTALVLLGLLLGAGARFVTHALHLTAIYVHDRPALQPLGSPGREALYRQLARKKPDVLVPHDITFVSRAIVWPKPEKHDEWAAVLGQNGFQLCGQHLIPEVKVELEFWINPAENLTAVVVSHPVAGMWVSAFTRYEDGSSVTTANKNSPGLDPHPKKKIIYLGEAATAQEVLDRLKAERPAEGQVRPRLETILPLYRQSWSEYMDWRRARGGTSAEEYKRIDERRHARKALASVE